MEISVKLDKDFERYFNFKLLEGWFWFEEW